MEDARAWVATGCASVVGLGAAAGTVPWWAAVIALTVGCGPQVRATAETVSNIVWQWKHPNCSCHTPRRAPAGSDGQAGDGRPDIRRR
jgi:hypothetical protein